MKIHITKCAKDKKMNILEMNDEEIIYERLDYVLLKNRGICFEITKEKASIVI